MADKAIFLDRDDTLIEDPGYINHPSQVKLLAGVPESLIEFNAMGYKLIIVSNQSAVARGIVTEEKLTEIHERLRQLLAEKGAFLDRIYYCPYHPDGVVKKYRKESSFRKPNPGMLLAASDEMDIDLSLSWMIGNNISDVEAGREVGCKTILIGHGSYQPELRQPEPDYKAVNIKEAVNIVKNYLRIPQQQKTGHSPPASNPRPQPPQQSTPTEKTEQLLGSILEQLKAMQRSEMFVEFSMARLIAGVVQVIVLFCLLISIWFLMDPAKKDSSVLITLGFAAVLQMMALTLYIMQGRK